MDLDAVLRRVVVVAHLHPALQREAVSSGKFELPLMK
jgi:hypothetical protein